MSDNLFAAAAEETRRARAPLAARLRPRTLDDVVGQEHLVGPGRPLRLLVESDRLSSALLWGPPGTGKTSLALAVAGSTERAFEQMSAVTAGVKDVRETIERAKQRLGERGQGTILFLDEIHRFSKSQQDALLPAVEDGTLTLIGATTENPFFEVNAPLRSRSTLFRLEPLDRNAIEQLVARGLQAESVTADPEATQLLVERSGGDGRQVLTSLDVACALSNYTHVELEHVEAALGTSALRYGQDDHYDVVSAFIKSMRGSDADASVYWLARMLEAGEDARFIARRMVIFASEDVGLADSRGLEVAVAAAHALDRVGSPKPNSTWHRQRFIWRLLPRATGQRWRSGMHGQRSKTEQSVRCRRTFEMGIIRARLNSVTVSATAILMTIRRDGSTSSICPSRWSVVTGMSRANTATRGRLQCARTNSPRISNDSRRTRTHRAVGVDDSRLHRIDRRAAACA